MLRENKTFNRCLATVAAFTIIVLGASNAWAQKGEFLSDAEQKRRITEVYAHAKTSKSSKDYSNFVEKCEGLLELELNAKNRVYVNTLKAWGLNRRGESRMETADMLIGAGNYSQGDQVLLTAYEDFELATVANPKRARAWLCKGIANVHLQKFEMAIDDFSKSIELAPKDPKLYFNRAEACYQAGQYSEAIKDYDFVLEKTSGDLQALTGRAHCFYEMAEFKKAIADLDAVVSLNPNSAIAWLNRAEANERLGEWSTAYADFMKSLELEPSEEAFGKAAKMLATCPDQEFMRPQEALELCQRAISKFGTSPIVLESQAAAETANGNFEKAEELQNQASQLSATIDMKTQARLATYEEAVDEEADKKD